MARTLHGDTEAAVVAEVVTRAVAVELAFASGTVRLNSTGDTLDIDGEDFLPAGILGTIGPVEETAELASTTLRMTLSGIPRDMAVIALDEAYQNLPAAVWEVVFDADTGAIIGDPIVIFRGRMDQLRLRIDGSTCTVDLDVTNRLVDWERPRRILFSDEEHRRRAGASDTAFRYAAAMAEREVAWPNGQYFSKVLFNVR